MEYENYREIRNTEPTSLCVSNFKKTGKFLITKQGRYGYPWVRNIVFWCAKKLGMIQNEKDNFINMVYSKTVIDLRDKNTESKIYSVIKLFLRCGFKPDDLIIVTGKEFFEGIIANQRSHLFTYPVRIGFKDQPWKIYGVKILITDYVEGFVVLPIEDLKGPSI